MTDFVAFITDSVNWLTCILSGLSFLLGIFVTNFVTDRFHLFFNKGKIRQQIIDKGVPQIYTTTLSSRIDYKQQENRLADCTVILSGEIMKKGDMKDALQIVLHKADKEDFSCLEKSLRLIHIENCTPYSCCIYAILDFSQKNLKYESPNLAFIRSSTSVALIVDEYSHPFAIIIDYVGKKLRYVIADNSGSIACEVVKKSMKIPT